MDQAGQLVDERHLRNTEMAEYRAAHVPPETYAVLKATRNWPCMYDLVKAHLARLNNLPTVYTAPPAVRDLRLATRHREWLTRQRTQAKNRIQAVLARSRTCLGGKDAAIWPTCCSVAPPGGPTRRGG